MGLNSLDNSWINGCGVWIVWSSFLPYFHVLILLMENSNYMDSINNNKYYFLKAYFEPGKCCVRHIHLLSFLQHDRWYYHHLAGSKRLCTIPRSFSEQQIELGLLLFLSPWLGPHQPAIPWLHMFLPNPKPSCPVFLLFAKSFWIICSHPSRPSSNITSFEVLSPHPATSRTGT